MNTRHERGEWRIFETVHFRKLRSTATFSRLLLSFSCHLYGYNQAKVQIYFWNINSPYPFTSLLLFLE